MLRAEIWHTNSYYDVGIQLKMTFENEIPEEVKYGFEICKSLGCMGKIV